MSSLNTRSTSYNHHNLKVANISNESKLTRMTLAHMLWEKQFYVDGADAATSMAELVPKVQPEFVAQLAYAARTQYKLRHVPLFLMCELARLGKLVAADLAGIIQRPDEMPEFLSMYWRNGKVPISNQVKKGLALAFGKFNEYALAKWDKNSAAISMRDVMFMTHPAPSSSQQEDLFKKVANKLLETPDTWETELSAGADKKETFERLMREGKLGALAFLRNLRNMDKAGVDESAIRAYASQVDVARVLPFRFIAAARIVPKYENVLESMMFRATAGMEKLPGKTVLLIDVSGSMFGTKVSAKSELDRFDAAAALAVLCRELCEEVEIFSFSHNALRVAPRRGFALIDAIKGSQQHGGTCLGKSMETVNATIGKYDRVIVFTDEQSSDKPVKRPNAKGYVLNVASYKNGINQEKDFLTVSGFSEASLDYIQMMEKE